MPQLAEDLNKTVNDRITKMQISGIRAFDGMCSKIPGILKLTLGEPDFNTPEHVKQAAIDGIKNNDSHYSVNRGKIELRQAIASYIKRSRGIDYDPETEIIVTIGGTEALTSTMMAMLNPGDKVIIPTPVFSLYFPIVEITGAKPILVNTASDDFNLTPERLEDEIAKAGDGVKAVMLNYPTNPTGRTYTKEQIQALAAVIKKHHLFAVVDEIYSSLIYGGRKHYSMATEMPERTILVSGLSKSHAMTGYRLGYICGPAKFVNEAGKIHSYLVTTATDASQDAAIEALNNGDEDPIKMRAEYEKRRDYLEAALRKLGFEMATPEGAFYMFAKIPAQYGTDDLKFATDLAKQAKVGLIPGNVFGPGGEGYVRLSYAASDADLHEAVKRISAFMEHLN
ncbi:aminotransferase class I/II-fold pyridoxal phosphate-dependent enzyme [Limosilactobacillus difficilis]|uniref:aminotransferase class I/II-fold pyridoxal phosphate-dependent enzyme n=1 Tax=Limosilactobacillus difficilis TaxID=2991838 RepID=UPI0024B9E62A|nr:aminotransferase class I/II-fold pyridoxal phosphate-dependent enzyme [Limosilactobacillus difficilis]